MKALRRGFTLIELSVVLVIIGLIVGGVLVGRDLINAAALQGTLSQIDKYNTAAHTFESKYGYLPGDVKGSVAASMGFLTRGGTAGWGDGNGILEGQADVTPGASGANSISGELCYFWTDLSTARLIDGRLTGGPSGYSASPCTMPWTVSSTAAEFDTYFPRAKLGQGNYIYTWNGGWGGGPNATGMNRINYFGIAALYTSWAASIGTIPGMTAIQAQNMDEKIDDGKPNTGSVRPLQNNGGWVIWASSIVNYSNGVPQAITCFNAGANRYSPATSGNNCALTFQFQ